ncbi:hypothetical protein [uncultured Carboxylicivirga sp.]|nr:hypothetical protein [uncultured Carboxylicivirga sp.]TRX71675.1 hypothetical protein FNN09_05400 [Carboxylicivirga sp. M1479]
MMKQLIITSLLAFLSMAAYAQEEFFRDRGGISLVYGQGITDDDHFNAMGFSFVFKGGFSLGLTSQKVNEEVNPQVFIGYLSPYKERKYYSRTSIQLSYMSSSVVSVVGLNFGLSCIINATKHFPTSFNGGLSLNHVTYKSSATYYSGYGGVSVMQDDTDFIPVIAFAINQAFFANQVLSPFVSLGIGYDLTNNSTVKSFLFGVNVNFNGKKKVSQPEVILN